MKKLIILFLLLPTLCWGGMIIQKFTSVSSSGFTVNQGAYTGNSTDDRQITCSGLTSSSDAMIFVVNGGAQSSAWRFPSQSGDISSEWADSKAEEADMIQAAGTDYFEVGTAYEVNNSANSYVWFTIDNDSSSNVEFGSYTGNGVDGRDIELSNITTIPDLVIVKSAGGAFGYIHSHAMGDSTDISGAFFQESFISNRIQGVGTGTFEVSNSSTMNSSGITYYYAAFKHVPGAFITGTYTGNATDDRSITGLGFQPDIVIVKAATAYMAVVHVTASGTTTDDTYPVSNSANGANMIQALESDGFQIGTDDTVNKNGDTYYYLAWKAGTHDD